MKSQEILKRYWGFSSFRGIQEEIINSSINGHDVLALLPTGGGKSLCYQIPGLARDGICIVISPLIALMQDQVDNLQSRGIRAKAIVSGMSKREIDIILDNAKFDGLDFLYVSPERLKSRLFLTRFEQMNVSLIAIDEAHCISQWGHDFRPSYREISKIREIHPRVPLIAVTATATKEVREDIQEQLALKNPKYYEGSFARKNISYELYREDDKMGEILSILSHYKNTSGIIYCQTRRDTKNIAKMISAHNFSVGIYHGGMTGDKRAEVQQSWIKNQINIIVATNAFGMGIDKPDVRFVIHFQLPNSIEAYFQEAGRAGRDGNESRTFGLYSQNDILELKNQIKSKFPEISLIKNTYRALCNYLRLAIGSGENETYAFDLRDFTKKYNLDTLTTYNSLKILELNNDIILNEAIHHPTRFKFALSNTAIYSFQIKYEQYSNLITWLSRSYPGVFSEFAKIDEAKIAKRLNIHHDKLIKQLKYLETHGVIDVQWASDLPQVTFVHERLPDDYLRIKNEAYNLRKELALKKVEAMINLISKKECRSIQILEYFNQKSTPCEKCDICLEEKKIKYSSKELSKRIMEIIDIEQITYKSLLEKLNISNKDLLMHTLDRLQENNTIDVHRNIIRKIE